MGRQGNYIISAFLLLVFFLTGYFFIRKIFFLESERTSSQEVVSVVPTVYDYSGQALQGKTIFMSNCAACHNLFKDMTGPSLIDIIDNDQWKDRKKLYAWIRNPIGFMQKDAYTKQLKEKFGSMMTAFPDLKDEEIDAIIVYIQQSGKIKYQDLPVAKR
ncbi:MAG: cytochrome c [Chitinophagaceae bacterium]